MWTQGSNDRIMNLHVWGVGYCSLVCPNFGANDERHNKWELHWQDDVPPTFGVYGDDVEQIVRKVNVYIAQRLAEAIKNVLACEKIQPEAE